MIAPNFDLKIEKPKEQKEEKKDSKEASKKDEE